MDNRLLVTLPLSPVHKTSLHRNGIITVTDVEGADKKEISQVTGLSLTEVEDIFDIIKQTNKSRPKPVSAAELLKTEDESVPIVSFCEKLDEALGGGVQLGQLTEISGKPGVGKTQLCIQLACDVQIPALFGGLGGEAVYVDTKAGFVTSRVVEITTATVNHCKEIVSQEQDPDTQQFLADFTIEKLLSGIHVYKCHSESHLLAFTNLLPNILQENPKVKLVVIDSIAFHFRHDFEDLSLRTRILTNLAQTLLSIAKKFNISIVVTNQMTTKVRKSDMSSVVPALGDSWGHACTNRITLESEAGRDRVARVWKSPSQKSGKVFYQITKDGFRDSVMSFEEENDSLMKDQIASEENPSKRQRYT